MNAAFPSRPAPASLVNLPAEEWSYYRLSVPTDALRVKTKARLARDGTPHCGLILWPDVFIGDVKNNAELCAFIREHAVETACVVGHGTFGLDMFVWIGSIEEFLNTWEGD